MGPHIRFISLRSIQLTLVNNWPVVNTLYLTNLPPFFPMNLFSFPFYSNFLFFNLVRSTHVFEPNHPHPFSPFTNDTWTKILDTNEGYIVDGKLKLAVFVSICQEVTNVFDWPLVGLTNALNKPEPDHYVTSPYICTKDGVWHLYLSKFEGKLFLFADVLDLKSNAERIAFDFNVQLSHGAYQDSKKCKFILFFTRLIFFTQPFL
jgi:hypothetical protein